MVDLEEIGDRRPNLLYILELASVDSHAKKNVRGEAMMDFFVGLFTNDRR